MKIIVFEGMDKSGKNTASLKLYSYLLGLGYKVKHSEFHRYDTETGKLIKKYLYGQYKVSNETIQYIMSADKQAQQDWFKELEKEGYDFLILDRYYLSQIVYSNYFLYSSKFDKETQESYREIYKKITDNFKKADLTIYLDNSAEVSMSRKGQHGENDRYESDKELLEYVRLEYLRLVKNEAKHIIVSSEQAIDDVHSEMIEKFNTIMK